MAAIYGLRLACNGDTTPSPSTWFLFTVGSLLSLITYRCAGYHPLSNETVFWLSFLANAATLFGVLRGREEPIRFDGFDRLCFAAVGIILIVILVCRMYAVANVAIQAVMFIGYGPTFKKLAALERKTESLSVWIGNGFSSAIFIYLPLRSWDLLGAAYPIRALICIVVMIFLLCRIEYRARRR
jgi:multisubunit Na+/H+ antiporter MnhF subunit